MRIRELIIEVIGYKLFPCFYNRFHDPLFHFIRKKVPKDFLHRKMWDFGCGDGDNTVRLQKVFQPQDIVACDRSQVMLDRARSKGFKVQYLDFNSEFPKGEMAAFTYSLHHAYQKEKTLQKAVDGFKYLFICEPYLNLFYFFNWGHVPSKKIWIALFDMVLKNYSLYEYKNNLIVFYEKR